MLESIVKKSAFREMLDRASRTQPSSNIRPLHSLDQLARTALDATPSIVDLECTRDRLKKAYDDAKAEAEAYLEKLQTEFEDKITKTEIALEKARTERRRAQYRTIRQQIELGVFEDVKSLDELARSNEFKESA